MEIKVKYRLLEDNDTIEQTFIGKDLDECLRLQGFHEDWMDNYCQPYEIVGIKYIKQYEQH